MATVLDDHFMHTVVVPFFERARGSGRQAKVSYTQLVTMVGHVGLTPEQCIYFTEAKWNTPSPQHPSVPGLNRNGLAGSVLKAIVKHKQVACKNNCGVYFKHMNPCQLTQVHLGSPSKYSNYHENL